MEAANGPLSPDELQLVAPALQGTGKGDREWTLYQLLCQHYVPWRYAFRCQACADLLTTDTRHVMKSTQCFPDTKYVHAHKRGSMHWRMDLLDNSVAVPADRYLACVKRDLLLCDAGVPSR